VIVSVCSHRHLSTSAANTDVLDQPIASTLCEPQGSPVLLLSNSFERALTSILDEEWRFTRQYRGT
jgi:hypothetical protein